MPYLATGMPPGSCEETLTLARTLTLALMFDHLDRGDGRAVHIELVSLRDVPSMIVRCGLRAHPNPNPNVTLTLIIVARALLCLGCSMGRAQSSLLGVVMNSCDRSREVH